MTWLPYGPVSRPHPVVEPKGGLGTDTLVYNEQTRPVEVSKRSAAIYRVPTAQGKQGKWPPKKSLSGRTQGIWKFGQNAGKTQGIWFAQSVNSLILKVKKYFKICRGNSQIFFEAGQVCQVSFVYVIVTNHVKWHRGNLLSDKENTGNLKMKFEWVPCM